MSPSNIFEKIAIVDFGSQFTQLIARKVRELGVYSEIINFNQIRDLKNNKSTKGIVLSGGPLTATNKNFASLDKYILDLNLLMHFINKQKKIIFAKLNTTEKKVTGLTEKFLKIYNAI